MDTMRIESTDTDAAVAASYRRRAEILSRRTPNSAVLCPYDAGGVVVLTGSGALLWDVLAQPMSLDAVVAAMASAYSVAPDVVARDVAHALDDLMNRRLIEVAVP